MTGDIWWESRFEEAATDHDRMGVAWSHLLASIASSNVDAITLNKIRNDVTVELLDAASRTWQST